jgi:hypothetical protein
MDLLLQSTRELSAQAAGGPAGLDRHGGDLVVEVGFAHDGEGQTFTCGM